MDDKKMAPHEGLQISELLTMKNLSLTKAITMQPLITDEELKNIAQQHIGTNEGHIKELKDIIEISKFNLG